MRLITQGVYRDRIWPFFFFTVEGRTGLQISTVYRGSWKSLTDYKAYLCREKEFEWPGKSTQVRGLMDDIGMTMQYPLISAGLQT